MTGQQEGDQLVTELGVVEPVGVVAGRHQPGQHVLAVLHVRHGAAFCDLGVDPAVELDLVVDGPPPGTETLQPRIGPAEQDARVDVDRRSHPGPELGEPLLVGHTEDDPQDHLERQRVHPVERGKLLAVTPAIDLGGRDLRDHRPVAPQRVTEEGRHQQLAGPVVVVPVLEQQRVLAHDRAEHGVALACVEDRRIGGEDLLGDVRAREQHQRARAGDQPQGERLAVLAVEVGMELVAEPHQRDRLRQRRPARPRGQRAARDPRLVRVADERASLEALHRERAGVDHRVVGELCGHAKTVLRRGPWRFLSRSALWPRRSGTVPRWSRRSPWRPSHRWSRRSPWRPSHRWSRRSPWRPSRDPISAAARPGGRWRRLPSAPPRRAC